MQASKIIVVKGTAHFTIEPEKRLDEVMFVMTGRGIDHG